MLELMGKDQIRLIVNRISKKMAKAMKLTIDDIMDNAGLPLLGVVPEDPNVTLAAAFEIGRRCAGESAVESRSAIASPRTVFRMMLPVLKDLDHEECWVLYLNRANFLISKEKVSSGGLDSTTLDSRTIVRKAIEKKASGIILVHNHPSGSAMPGTADINSTKQLDRILKTCEISLIDHVVIAENSFYSFADEELVQG